MTIIMVAERNFASSVEILDMHGLIVPHVNQSAGAARKKAIGQKFASLDQHSPLEPLGLA